MPMTEDQLRAITDAEMRSSIGYWGGKLAEQRRKAEYYYLGLAKGDLAPPEVDGRSSVVSTDVRNTIEAMLPQLMAKFTGGDSVVEFEPSKPGDEDKARICTDYLNYLFFKQVNGHSITYTWFKDALLQKRGIIKVWWDTRDEESREEYKGLSEVELAQILEDEEVEPIEQKSYPDEDDAEQRQKAVEQLTQQLQQATQDAQQGNQQAAQAAQQIQAQLAQIEQKPPVMLYDIAVKRVKSGGKLAVENVPPEEFLISRKAKDIASAPFVGHRVLRTASELKSMGYKNVDNLTSDDAAVSMNMERVERMSYDDEQPYIQQQPESMDDSQRAIWVTECYIRCDWDGDGIAELRKVVRAGNEVLENEEVDVIPFCSVCPVPLPHKFFGLSIADLAMESQKTKTSILRARLDNMYLDVNGRYFAVEGQVNLDDLLTSRPGGVVRVKQPNAVGRLDQGQGNAGEAQSMSEYMEGFLESSTGWTRYSQGNSALDLQSTATGANIITNKDDMRLDLIARNFAEGFVELFRMMLKLVCQHQNKKREAKIAGGWLEIDPREWRNQFDVSINVGLGVGNKDQQVGHMMALIQKQAEGLSINISTPQNIYESNKELAKLLGFKSADKFFSDPSKMPPKPPQTPPEVIKGQVTMQVEQAKIQYAGQLEQAKLQQQAQLDQVKREHELAIERMKMEMQAQVDNNRQQAEAQQKTLEIQQQAQLDALRLQHEQERKLQEMEFNRWKAQLEAETKVLVAQIGASCKEAETPQEQMTEKGEEPDTGSVLAAAMQGFTAALGQMNQPRQIIRGPDGRVAGIA